MSENKNLPENVVDYCRIYFDYLRRLNKTLTLLREKPDVDVGTTPKEIVHQKNDVKLYRYLSSNVKRQTSNVKRQTSNVKRPPILLVYALVNRPYIMDLQPDRSIVRTLLNNGLDVFLIDWDYPSACDKYLEIKDYIHRFIDEFVDKVCEVTNRKKISMLGYCMGGTFATIYTALYPEKINSLIVEASLIDFRSERGLLNLWADDKYFNTDKIVDTMGLIPGDFLNTAFLLLNPVGNLLGKYISIVDDIDDEEKVKNFLRMEKWIYDSVPLVGETYREFIKKGYQQNLLIQNKWDLDGQIINLKNITCPLLILVADKDHIVPPETTTPLYDAVSSKEKKIIRYPAGHIGLSVSSKAHVELWPEVAKWVIKVGY